MVGYRALLLKCLNPDNSRTFDFAPGCILDDPHACQTRRIKELKAVPALFGSGVKRHSMVTAGCALCPFLQNPWGHQALDRLVLFLPRRRKLLFGALPQAAGICLVTRISKNCF